VINDSDKPCAGDRKFCQGGRADGNVFVPEPEGHSPDGTGCRNLSIVCIGADQSTPPRPFAVTPFHPGHSKEKA
jgi:hypothetical protein